MKRIRIFLSISILMLIGLACNAFPSQVTPTIQILPQPTSSLPQLEEATNAAPLTEATVPRIAVDEAKAALDSGEAVIIDVRSADAYANSHAEGAINIPLGEFETDIANVQLEKDQWIITYCT